MPGHMAPVVALARVSHDIIVSADRDGGAYLGCTFRRHLRRRMKLSENIEHLMTLEDEVIGVSASAGNLHRFNKLALENEVNGVGASAENLHRFKKWTESSELGLLEQLPLRKISKFAVPKAGNFFVGVADDTICVVRRTGDEVPEEKIDDEFEKWVEEWSKPKKKVKKPWYACG